MVLQVTKKSPGAAEYDNFIVIKDGSGSGGFALPFKDIVDSLIEGVGIIDDCDRIIFLNRIFLDILEVDSDDKLIGKSIIDFIEKSDHETIAKQGQLRRNGIRSQYNIAARTARGKRRYVNVDVSPLMVDEKYIGAFIRLVDITSNKLAIDKYSRDIEKYSYIIEHIGIGVAVINPNMEIISANQTLKRVFPALNDNKACLCYETYHYPPRHEICSYCPIVRSFADGEAHTEIAEVSTPTGSINVRIMAYPLKDDDGTVISVVEVVEDMTDEIQRAMQDKRDLNFLETLMDTIPSPIYYKDVNGTYLGCNESFARIVFGGEKRDVIGKSLNDFKGIMPDELIKGYQKKDRELLRRPGMQYYDAEVLCADGKEREFHFAKATFLDTGGKVAGVIGVMVDITEKRNIERELRSRTKLLSERLKEQNCLYQIMKKASEKDISVGDFMEFIIDQIVISWQYPEITCAGIELQTESYTSNNFRECGHRLIAAIIRGDKSIGKIEVGYTEDRPPEDIGPFYKEEKLLLDIIASNIARFIESREFDEYRNKLTTDLVKSNNRLESALDEAARAKKLLSQTISRYTAMINTVPAVIYLKSKNNTYIEVNEAFCKLSGKTKEDIIGFEDYDVFSSEMASTNSAEDKEIITTGNRIINREHSFTNSGNEVRWISSTKLPLYDESRNISGMVGLLQDVTELHMNRQKLIQSDKLAAIGQLAAGVAHEINNPIGYINSNLSFMKKSLGKIETYIAKHGGECQHDELEDILADCKDAVTESIEGTEKVKDIVADLKSFSRVDRTVKEQTDLNDGLRSTLNVVWNELKYKAKVITDYGEIPMVYCMANQINQVFMNILVNAAHAIKYEKGEIAIKTYTDEDRVYISIKDNGVGIPEKKLKKIFEPFYTTKEVGKGTGLGLSLAYDIIEKHRGTIDVRSAVGKGTEFIIVLPVGSFDLDESDEE